MKINRDLSTSPAHASYPSFEWLKDGYSFSMTDQK